MLGHKMRRIAIGLICALLAPAVFAQDSIRRAFAAARSTSLSVPSLSDIMVDTQLRHIKLCLAGRGGKMGSRQI